MTPEKVLTLEQAEATWRLLPKNAETAGMLTAWLETLPEADRRKFLRGKRAQIKQAVWESKRAAAYESNRAAAVGTALQDLGLIDLATWRDKSTGRKCKTVLIELARLQWDWQSEDAHRVLKENWAAFMQLPIAKLKARIRTMRGRQANRRAICRKRIVAAFNEALAELSPEDGYRLAGEIILSLDNWLTANSPKFGQVQP